MHFVVEADQLVRGAVAGDQLALGRLLLRQSHRLAQRITARMPLNLRSVVDCDDVLQQTFVRIVRDIRQLREVHSDGFTCWATQVADHCLQDIVRSARAQKRGAGRSRNGRNLMDQASPVSSPSRKVERTEIVQAVQSALAALPGEQREAIARVCLGQLSYASAARQIGRSHSAVRSLTHRAKQHLRTLFGPPSDWI